MIPEPNVGALIAKESYQWPGAEAIAKNRNRNRTAPEAEAEGAAKQSCENLLGKLAKDEGTLTKRYQSLLLNYKTIKLKTKWNWNCREQSEIQR